MLLTDVLLLDYKRCQRRAFLDSYGDSQSKRPEKDFLLKLREESRKHIQYLVNTQYPYARSLISSKNDLQAQAEETEVLMKQGVDCILQGTLRCLHATGISLIGRPDLLVKQTGKSKWGDWLYIPISIHFGRRPKPEYKLIATFYAYLLTQIQQVSPPKSELILRRHNHHVVNLSAWEPRLKSVLSDCITMLLAKNEPEVFISRQRCSLCHWYNDCYRLAQSQSHLSLVPGVTPSRYSYLQTLGIITLELLATTHPTHLTDMMSLEMAKQLQQQAQALWENRPILKPSSAKRVIPSEAVELYFDIEAEPEHNLDYLLGILEVNRQNQTEIFHSFLAETPQAEAQNWHAFLEFVNQYETAPIFHFSEYEAETIKRLATLYQTSPLEKEQLLSRLVDLHQIVIHRVILPVESYSLKAIANWIGFQWRDQGAGGDQCVFWYDQWLKTQDSSFLALILRYNEDDCRATFWLKDWLTGFLV